MRADKFLWAVRLYKTRSLATEACKKGRVMIDNMPVKPARELKAGDVLQVRKSPIEYTYKIKALLKSRVGAKLVNDYIEDLTPQEELDKLIHTERFFVRRDRGSGRPTKKERRMIDKFTK